MNNIKVTKMALILTTACNMRCTYCFESEDGYKPEYMELNTIEESIKRFLEESTVDVSNCRIELFGGEPLLDFNTVKFCYDVMTKYKRPGTNLSVWITSNMFKTDERILEFINNHPIQTKLTISILLDEELHNAERIDCAGNGTYKSVLANTLNAISKYKKIHYQLHQVISPRVIRSGKLPSIYEESIKFMKDYGVVVSTNPVSIGSTHEDNYTAEDIKTAVLETNEHILKHKNFITNMDKDICGEYIGHWVARIQLLGKADRITFCGDLKKHITIGVDGKTHMCHRMYLGSEMNSGPVSSIFDADVFVHHTSAYSTMLSTASEGDAILNDRGLYEINRTTSVGYDCKECLAGYECHPCYVPMIGENKNIKSAPDCINTRAKVKYKMNYHIYKIKNEHLIANEKVAYELNRIKFSYPELSNLVDMLIEQTAISDSILRAVKTEYCSE